MRYIEQEPGVIKKIMHYFQPKYWFGMSASPERTDDFDIYSLFDHNILYEIRLQQALEDNLLCNRVSALF